MSAVADGLVTAAGLVERIDHVKIEALQELQRGYPHLRLERIDVTRHEKAESHRDFFRGKRALNIRKPSANAALKACTKLM